MRKEANLILPCFLAHGDENGKSGRGEKEAPLSRFPVLRPARLGSAGP